MASEIHALKLPYKSEFRMPAPPTGAIGHHLYSRTVDQTLSEFFDASMDGSKESEIRRETSMVCLANAKREMKMNKESGNCCDERLTELFVLAAALHCKLACWKRSGCCPVSAECSEAVYKLALDLIEMTDMYPESDHSRPGYVKRSVHDLIEGLQDAANKETASGKLIISTLQQHICALERSIGHMGEVPAK